MLRRTLALSFLALATSTTQAQEPLGSVGGPRARPAWSRGLGIPGAGLGGNILCWAVYDDGRGPAVYAGGWFWAADDQVANGVARWNGSAWEPVGGGIRLTFAQEVRALAVYDDGSGPALYAAGQFDRIDGQPAAGFARWDGRSWSALPGQVGFGIHRLLVGDTGQGPSLFAGGEFIRVGGIVTNNVARWDGSWRPIGAGLPRPVHSLAFFDDGGGQKLYAGVEFQSGQTALRRWDGAAWTQVPGAPTQLINALRVYDDGNGAKLAAGGGFGPPSAVQSWDGLAWSSLGTLSSIVQDLDLLPGPGGSDLLVAAGMLFSADGVNPAGNVTVWDGSGWQTLGSPPGTTTPIESMAVLDLGQGPDVYVGGFIGQAGSVLVRGAARWDGASWSGLGGAQHGLDRGVYDLIVFDDGSGPALYAGGGFEFSGVVQARGVARWNGTSWDEVGGGLQMGTGTGVAFDLTSFQSGDGPVLIAAGQFTVAGAVAARNIARWNGTAWSVLGPGIFGGVVNAVQTFDDGLQQLLYAGGNFFPTSGQPGSKIAAWNGVSGTWSALPGELTTAGGGINTTVNDLALFDDGGGSVLYVAGDFDFAGRVPVDNLARWNGSTWQAAPFGGLTSSDPFTNAQVRRCWAVDAPAVGGPALIVQGTFDTAGSLAVDGLALLDASGWQAPGSFSRATIQSVATYDAGRGPELYALDSLAGLVRWDGLDWIPLASGPLENRPTTAGQPAARVLHGFDDGGGPALFVGGDFHKAGPLVSTNIARWLLGGKRLSPLPR